MNVSVKCARFALACAAIGVAGSAYAGVATYYFKGAPPPGAGAVKGGVVFSGFVANKTVTADSGAEIAIISSTKSVVKPYVTYSLAQPCGFKYDHVFAHVAGTIPSGEVAISYIGEPKKENQFLNKPLRFIVTQRGSDIVQMFAVDDTGVILPYLFTENLAVLRADPALTPDIDASDHKVQFTPSVCRLTKTVVPIGTSVIPGEDRVIEYTGRNSRGFLTFSTVLKRDANDVDASVPSSDNDATIPAQPGIYTVFGMPIRIISTSQFKITYSIPSIDEAASARTPAR